MFRRGCRESLCDACANEMEWGQDAAACELVSSPTPTAALPQRCLLTARVSYRVERSSMPPARRLQQRSQLEPAFHAEASSGSTAETVVRPQSAGRA